MAEGDGRRPERVSEMVLRELSQMLVRDLKDPRLRGVTLTSVRMTDDLRHGRVFFSHLEGRPQAAEAIEAFAVRADSSAGKSGARWVCATLPSSISNSIRARRVPPESARCYARCAPRNEPVTGPLPLRRYPDLITRQS